MIKETFYHEFRKEIIKIIKTCSYCGKEDKNGRKYNNKLYCGRHYRQLLKYGEIISTRCDDNIIEIKDNIAQISLCNKNGEIINETIIDLDDVILISKYKWFYDSKTGYAVTHYDNRVCRMHQILVCNDIDHIDRDKLNNCKDNFRPINKSQNMMNSNTSIRNTSGVKGVSWDANRMKWTAYIKANGEKMINIGRFNSFNDAVKQRMIYEAKIFGIYSQYYNNGIIDFKYTDNNKNINTLKINMLGEIIYED